MADEVKDVFEVLEGFEGQLLSLSKAPKIIGTKAVNGSARKSWQAVSLPTGLVGLSKRLALFLFRDACPQKQAIDLSP